MRARDLATELARGFLDLVLAPECVACGSPVHPREAQHYVCRSCWARARVLPLPRCTRCWTPRPSQPVELPPGACGVCAALPPSLRALRSAYVHQGPVREMVHALKFRGWRCMAEPLALRMAELPWPLEVSEEVRLVVPVPLSPVRLRERGYNQAALLAAGIAPRHGWTVESNLLLRVRATERQSGLHPDERRANVTDAFRVRPGSEADVRGEHLLLVDDVWTTGATALACGAALLAAGARAYSVVTLARALPELDR